MPKILFILPTFSAGGAENYVLRFLKHFHKDFDFHILSVSQNQGDLHEEFKALDIPMFYQSLGYFDIKKMLAFHKLVKEQDYDTIVSFTGNFSGLPLTIAKYGGVKNRIVFHRRSTNAFGKNPVKLFYNKFVNYLLRKNATLILSNSEAAFQNFYEDLYKNNPKYIIIKNGVDVKEFKIETSKEEAREIIGLPQEKYIIGHVGRFDPAKNHQTIFKVIKNLKVSCEDIIFVFCGRGTDSEGFLNLIKEYYLEDVVISLGMRRDLPLVYRAFDVFYFPSITEGQPNALIEAMISGLPVVTSNIPPILETLPPGNESISLEPLDVVSAAKTLEGFYNKTIDESLYIHQMWAKNNFDSNERFNEFKSFLQKA